jgi:hypothetical protein
MHYELQAKITSRVAEWLGNHEWKKKAQKYHKLNNRVAVVEKLFRHFVATDWCFESIKIVEIFDNMDPEQRKLFNCNPRVIDWKVLTALNLYGLQKYVLRMDVSPPFHEQSKLITPLNMNYFQDAQMFI